MAVYVFDVEVSGEGDNQEEAWENAQDCDAPFIECFTEEEHEVQSRLKNAAPKLLKALELILFGLTKDADNNGGEVDRHALILTARKALIEFPGMQEQREVTDEELHSEARDTGA